MRVALYHNERRIGTVMVEKLGLFYKITCRFRCRDIDRVRLYAISANRYIDIGLCSCDGNEWGTEKSIAVKHVGDSIERFCLVDECINSGIKVEEGKPFSMLEKLTHAQLDVRACGLFIQFTDIHPM